jgi:PKD repeat protein
MRTRTRRRITALAVDALESRQLMSSTASLLYDFGSGTAASPNAYPVSITTYSAARGYGWQPTTGLSLAKASTPPAPFINPGIAGVTGTFVADMPNGVYTVQAFFNQTPLQVQAQGLPAYGGTLPSLNPYQEPVFPVTVSGGQLQMQFTSSDGKTPVTLYGLSVSAFASASVTPPNGAKEGSPVAFAGTAFVGYKPTFSWDFGDGTTASGSLTPSHTYLDNGTYLVTLNAANSTGLQATDSQIVTVANVPPTLTFTSPTTSGLTGQSMSFPSTVTDPSAIDTAAGLTYAWDFGDGTTSSVATPAHTYANSGTYTVTVSVTDKDGGFSSATTTATVDDYVSAPTLTICDDCDPLPNFAARPTVISVHSGPWSSASTWSTGQVPQAGDVVAIMAGSSVTYDMASSPSLDTVAVEPGGLLQFRTDINTQILAANILVFYGGTLQVGTAGKPIAPGVRADIVIADKPLDLVNDPSQYGTGLIAFGTVQMSGSPLPQTFVRLATAPQAGDTSLTLSAPVSGWHVGDELILPDTRQLAWNQIGANYAPQWEQMAIAGVSPDGLTITLAAPLLYSHQGGVNASGAVQYLPHVADLSRNVMIESQNPAGTRGHTFFTNYADVDIRYVAFCNLGRTLNSVPVDDTTYAADGTVTHVGTNVKGRYAMHFHHLYGRMGGQPNGEQFTAIGNVVDNDGPNTDAKWGIVIHETSFGLVQDNVVYNLAGAGIVTENGTETYDRIQHNFVMRINGTGDRYGNGRDGDAFWLRGPDNYIINNVAADMNATNGYCYGFDVFANMLGVVTVPSFPGANPDLPGQGRAVDMNATPLLKFLGNETYGATAKGFTLWWIGTSYQTPSLTVGTSIMKNCVVWNIFQDAYFGYETNNLLIDGFVALGDPNALKYVGAPHGMNFVDYYQHNLTVNNADIENMGIGVIPSVNGGPQAFTNSYFQNYMDAEITMLWFNGRRGDKILPRSLVFRNDTFNLARMPTVNGKPPLAFYMNTTKDPNMGSRNLIQSDTIVVYQYNRNAKDNFRLYYNEQAATYVLPQTTYNPDGSPNVVGAPVAGLTNQQAWNRYHVAWAGAVAPTAAKARQITNGLVLAF